jgi:hypothetical protein
MLPDKDMIRIKNKKIKDGILKDLLKGVALVLPIELFDVMLLLTLAIISIDKFVVLTFGS